jgi:hypothetical protein
MEILSSPASDLWCADRSFKLPIVGAEIGVRMTVIRLQDGGLMLHSPIRLDRATRDALGALGPVRAIVAPSKVHHLFVADYRSAYPEAKFYAAPGLQEKRKELRFDEVLSDQAPDAWCGQIEQHLFQGAPILNEVVFFHKASRTVVFTDLVFNIPADKAASAPVFFWILGASGRFGPHRLMRVRGIWDRRAARASVEQIMRWDFDRIIMSHGDVLEAGGRGRLAKAFAFLC